MRSSSWGLWSRRRPRHPGAPRIASVFMNRLRDQFSAEASADRPDHRVRLHRSTKSSVQEVRGAHPDAQLKDKDALSTYANPGLPPGPIANPGRESLAAVMQPDSSGYFYFVSKNDGTHVFSKTRDEHEVAVDKYQRKPAPE